MRADGIHLFVLAVCQILLGIVFTGASAAQPRPDSDWPGGLEAGGEAIFGGNPLAKHDNPVTLRGSYRTARGHLGLEALIGYADPHSEFVKGLLRDLGSDDADLLIADFSVVWYMNYPEKYAKDPEEWPPRYRIKPEFILFGGPGWASLRVDDAVDSPLSSASQDYFTLHAGTGVKLHYRYGPDYTTSRFYLRPELRGRWFTGEGGDFDWGASLSFGFGIGKRPTHGALRLKVKQARIDVATFVNNARRTQDAPPQPGDKQGEEAVTALTRQQELAGWVSYIEELEAYVVKCGAKCDDLRPWIAQCFEILNTLCFDLLNADCGSTS